MEGIVIALLGAALAVFMAGSGSAIGIGYVGSAANGLLSEEPEKFGSMFLLVALPGTQGIYGFVVGFLVLIKVGLIAGNLAVLTVSQGLQIFAACLPIAFAGLISAIHQGKVCAAGIAVAAKQPSSIMKALVYGVLVETYALIGFVASFFILNGIKI